MIPNFYESKNFRYLPIFPIALLLISLYFIPHIQLDSSLRGGISINIQTNSSSIDPRALTAAINAKIPGAQASVSQAQSGVSITIAANQSLSDAQQLLISVYGSDANYSAYAAKVAAYQNQLLSGPNATASADLAAAQADQAGSLSALKTEVSSMQSGLQPLLKLTNYNYSYNSTNPQAMLNAGKNMYTNASAAYKTYIIGTLHGITPFTTYTYQDVTPTLGAYFLSQMQSIILWSFILVALAVFFIFRTPIPSFSVVFGAGNDIIVALGAMGLFGIPLGVASIGGLLMLIGYSIDTDMLAAIRVLKRAESTPAERAFSTMKTGVTMTTAAIISFAILLVVSYVTFIPVYFEISSVVLFGLIGDLFTTWLGNTPMVLWYKQRKDTVQG